MITRCLVCQQLTDIVDGRYAQHFTIGPLAQVDRIECRNSGLPVVINNLPRYVQSAKRVPLFQLGNFTLRSGAKSAWKIECDALTPDDWVALARMASEILPPFRGAIGVPRGGLPFAHALNHYATGERSHPWLIAEDVCTTGGSMERYLEHLRHNPLESYKDLEEYRADPPYKNVIGVTVFLRGVCPAWVTPLFTMTQRKK